MKNKIYLLLALCLFSCNSETPQVNHIKPGKEKKVEDINLTLNNPVQLDSSNFVMYPLVLTTDEYKTDDSYGKSSGRTSTYWNIIFYNTANGESHLLDENRKMVIYQYQQNSESSGQNNINHTTNKLIFYTVKTLDHNQNGILDYKDPDYLFTSDNEGKNFKQISPPGATVNDWQLIEKTNKILMMVAFDTNKDKKFNEDDTVTPMIYDLNTNTVSKEIFDTKFTSKIKNLLDKNWLKKPKNND